MDILYIEDEPRDAQLAVQALSKAGIANRIEVARDGAAALQWLFGEGEGERITLSADHFT